jgi:prevent-host-death family protein
MYPHKVQCNYMKEHPMTNMRVGTRELKSKLSEYLRRVKAGETIIVTERGKTIGQITPVKPTVGKRMKALVESGAAEWNGKKYRPKKPAAQNRGRKQVSDLVIEDRDGHTLP